jgi:hypothetical protein
MGLPPGAPDLLISAEGGRDEARGVRRVSNVEGPVLGRFEGGGDLVRDLERERSLSLRGGGVLRLGDLEYLRDKGDRERLLGNGDRERLLYGGDLDLRSK